MIDVTTTFAVISWKKEPYRIMIADKIKNARTIKKLTQEQVAEDLNVSRQTISNWENGKSLPDIVSIIRMSELYDLSLDELLKGDATLLNKIERDMKVAKAENNVIKFVRKRSDTYLIDMLQVLEVR